MNLRTIGKKIITFYSYKGGVGRTQLLSNVAAFLCFQRHKRVLLIDWDLEAPGLHFYLGIEKSQIVKGTIDLFDDYVKLIRRSEKPLSQDEMPYFDASYIVPTHYRSEEGGRVDMISAGKQDENFTKKVNDFAWQHFYQNLDGAAYIEFLKTSLKELDYDYIFIDSRTGINDYSGICNIQFPDINVIIAAPNYQNLNGSLDICKKISESPYLDLELEGQPLRKPYIFPILSRLDLSEDTHSSEWILRFSREFHPYIQKTLALEGLQKSSKDFVDDTNIYYVKELSYKETIVFQQTENEQDFSGIKEQFRELSKYLLSEQRNAQKANAEQQFQQQQKVEFKPQNEAEAYLNMGNSFAFLGKYEEAKAQYLRAIEIDANNHQAFSNLGLAYLNLQDPKTAISYLQKAVEIKSDNYQTWNNLGNAYYALMQYEQARLCFERAVENQPYYHQGFYNLACLYSLEKNKSQTLFYLEKALAIEPETYRLRAKEEKDLEWLWQDSDFLKLVE
ncbi:KGGVGR-motif variant AAA ATPase [Hugenholtzia roseola]|uniref:KGGVGR-motif variant AAA ATPase n=1 Tax=Hugenholtzia roseola TaxID=1002 RepID=UPI00040615B2|nr:tetratricopeptide repeat protein [Hugenholtzia roseola]